MSRCDLSIEPEAVLACREYSVEGATGSRYLRIAVAFPKKTSDARYECRAEISDDEQCVVRPMTGVDALDALMLAFINIGTELHLFTDSNLVTISRGLTDRKWGYVFRSYLTTH